MVFPASTSNGWQFVAQPIPLGTTCVTTQASPPSNAVLVDPLPTTLITFTPTQASKFGKSNLWTWAQNTWTVSNLPGVPKTYQGQRIAGAPVFQVEALV